MAITLFSARVPITSWSIQESAIPASNFVINEQDREKRQKCEGESAREQ